jgi:hypothetical protein
MDDRFLSIYLNDHLAGAMTGRELAQRCLSRNRGTSLGDFLERLLAEIEEDRSTLTDLIDRLHLRKDPLKPVMGWANEKLIRMKPNGSLPLVGYSTLRRFEELELLSTGIEGKRLLWRALSVVAEQDQRIHGPEMDRLAARAERQRDEVEGFRLEAARLALARRAG